MFLESSIGEDISSVHIQNRFFSGYVIKGHGISFFHKDFAELLHCVTKIINQRFRQEMSELASTDDIIGFLVAPYKELIGHVVLTVFLKLFKFFW